MNMTPESAEEKVIVYFDMSGVSEPMVARRTPNREHTYVVGLLGDLRYRYTLRRVLRRPKQMLRDRQWRALRNWLNGYLCEHEHDGWTHNCGRGWTTRAAQRRARRICARDWALLP